MHRPKTCHVIRNMLLGIVFCMLLDGCIFQQDTVVLAGKTAVRTAIVATGTKVGGSSKSSEGWVKSEEFDGHYSNSDNSSTGATRQLSPIEKLQTQLRKNYDKSMPPVLDYRQRVNVQVDMTYRQVLDLDEKNQILKSLIWYRQYWRDERITWNPNDYDGITEMSIPSASVWRPDIAVYEEVGARDLSPRIPFIKVTYTGDITYAEPTILETSCSVDTSFFPFDSQLCLMTFVSWSQPLTRIDLSAHRNSDVIDKDSAMYFIDSGEWVLLRFNVKKRISIYHTNKVKEDESTNTEDYSNHIEIPPTETTTHSHLGRNITKEMFSEVRYLIIIRRNSSLYMQSMLFPSILLTSVALLGFYLPPDSGERVGLQITILLTFMVFLLTVGEMFPASTGPYLGIYFVLSMAQLGVNILMTVVVLHLHFKPCIQNKEKWNKEHPLGFGPDKKRDSVIPVKLRRLLQFCNRYFDLSEEGASWMLPIRKTTKHKCPNIFIKIDGEDVEDTHEHEKQAIDENNITSETLSIASSIQDDNRKDTPDSDVLSAMITPYQEELSNEEVKRHTIPNVLSTPEIKKSPRIGSKSPLRKRLKLKTKTNSENTQTREDELQRMIDSFRLDVKDVVNKTFEKKEKDTEEEMEDEMEKEQEEWKSVARAVDRLFFRLYVFIMSTGHVILALVALVANFSIDWDI